MRVLMIGHSSVRGGAPNSQRLLARGFRDRGAEVVVAVPAGIRSDTGRDLHGEGIETIDTGPLLVTVHCSAGWQRVYSPNASKWVIKSLKSLTTSDTNTMRIVEAARPDVVHLNSITLLATARALHKNGVPFVWHVRESPIRGHFGVRTALIARALRNWPREVIFISEHDRRRWVGAKCGHVVPNWPDPMLFTCPEDPSESKRLLDIEYQRPVVAFLGGPGRIKGARVLVEAIEKLNRRRIDILCLMPNMADSKGPTRSHVSKVRDLFAPTPRLIRTLRRAPVAHHVRMMDWNSDVSPVLAACDMLVFPALEPHFARPVIEAAAAGRAAIASRLGGMEELIECGVTGILVRPGSAGQLADAIEELAKDGRKRRRMGMAGRLRARALYSPTENLDRIFRIVQLSVRQTGHEVNR